MRGPALRLLRLAPATRRSIALTAALSVGAAVLVVTQVGLLAAVVASAERGGIWTIQTGIFPENQASVRLHEACGFRVVGVRERLGRLHGRWRDVLLMERRSPALS